MATGVIPAPPPGFVREDADTIPPPPPGFELEAASGGVPPPPPGFVIETPAPAVPVAPTDQAPPTWADAAAGLVFPDKAPPVSPETPTILPEFMQPLRERFFPTSKVTGPAPGGRLPDKVLADFRAGGRDISPEEFAQLLSWTERGNMPMPEAAGIALSPSLSPEGRQLLKDAVLTAQVLNVNKERPAPPVIGKGATRSFAEGFLRGTTLNAVSPIPNSLPAPNRRAAELESEARNREHPLAAFGGEAVGSALPYTAGAKLLRAFRASRGLAPVGKGAEGAIAEGAKVGGPQAALYRPEGADNMSAGEEIEARAVQAGIGIAAGAAFDWAAIAGGEKIGKAFAPLFKRLQDKRYERALTKEARENGFEDLDGYLGSLIDIVQTEQGAVVRPKAEVTAQLPGAAPRADDASPPQSLPESVTPPPARPEFPAESELRAGAYNEKARSLGLNDEQRLALAPEDKRDPLTGFQGRRDREPTIKRAIEHVRNTDTPAQYVALDLVNLGGLNARFGEPGADKIFRDLSTIAREELDQLPGRTQIFRHGGDEMSAVAVGVDDATLTAALERIRARSTEYVRQNGLDQIPHTKAGKAPGTGLHYGTAPIRGDSTLDDVLELAHRRLENEKENLSVDAKLPEEARARGSVEQADRTQGVYSAAGGRGGGEGAQAQRPNQTPQRLAEYERLAAQTTDVEIRDDLRRRADILRAELRGEPTKTTPQERLRRAREIDPERDDLITAIRKLGGIDTRIESDYDGRLSHLPRRGFGLPAIERPGKGRTLDDLAEALHERGYLARRDVRELYEKLDRAAGGEELHSFNANFDETPAPARPSTSDRDWRYQDADAPIEGDFVIDTDAGTVAPAKAFTDENWERLALEERDAKEWFERERGDVGPRETKSDGGQTRLADPAQERGGNQPEPGKTGELPGIEPRDAGRQAIADAERVKDAERNGQSYVAPADGPGDLFAGPRPKQKTIDDKLYSNPFWVAARETARDIGLNPGRNAAAGFAGGVAGATNSDAEVGSAQWWLDVAAGAAAGVSVGQVLRQTRLLGAGSFVDNAQARLGDWIETLPLIGRGPADLRELKRKQRAMRDLIDRQTEAVGKELLKRFSPSERAMMADIIERRGIVADFNLIHRQAKELDDYIAATAGRMKELGMLSPELETGGYLHRYYAKHLGLDKSFRDAKRQTLAGSYSIARGTDDAFAREFLSPGATAIADDWLRVNKELRALEEKRTDLLDKDTAGRIAELKRERRDIEKRELREFVGIQNGKLRSFVFAADEAARVPRDAKEPDGTAALVDRPSVAAGALDARTMPEVPGVADLSPTDRVWSMRGTDGKDVVLHRDWTKAERTSWGEIEDAGYRYVRGMAEVAHDLSLATLYDTVARRGDWVNDTQLQTKGKAWVKVPDTGVGKNSPLKKYGALAGKYVRPDVWNGINNYGRAPFAAGRMGQVYRDALARWKMYKTVYNPVTHLNNTYSNIEMLYMSGYSGRDLADAVKIMAEGDGSAVWREARDAGLFGGDWTTSLLRTQEGGGSQALDELARQLREQPEIPDAALSLDVTMQVKDWWANTRASVAQADGAWKSGIAIAKAMGGTTIAGTRFATTPLRAAARAMQRAYKFEDDLFKLAAFAAERRRGASTDAAVQAANANFFDYQDVPEAIKWVRDFPIGSPFITYSYKAIPAIARNIVRHPERWVSLVAAYEAMNYAALTADGEMGPGEYWQYESAEEQTSAPWDRGRSFWGARNTVRMPYPESYRLAMGRMHAGGNPFASEAGGRKKIANAPTPAWGSSVFGSNPLHALLDSLVFNEDWKGKPLYKEGAPLDDKARAIASYLYQAWSPSNPLFPGSYAQTKILEGMANDAREDPEGVAAPMVAAANDIAGALGFQQLTGLDRAGNEILTRDALLSSVGIKLRPIQTDLSVDFESGHLDTKKKEAADWFRSREKLHSEGRLTDEQLADDEAEYDRMIDAAGAKQDKLFDAEAFLKKRASEAKRR